VGAPPGWAVGWARFQFKLILASREIKRKREAVKRVNGLLSGGLVLENMKRDGEFVTSCWLWIIEDEAVGESLS
jgi:hypothetical protein